MRLRPHPRRGARTSTSRSWRTCSTAWAATAFLAVALSLSDAAAALHSLFLAVGLLSAGLIGDRLDQFRVPHRHWLAYLLLIAASVCIATAPAFPVTLAGAAMVGLGTGLLLAHLNRTLTRGGGALARVRMSRSALVAMMATMSVPIAIGIGENTGVGWQMAFVVAIALVATGLCVSRRRPQIAARLSSAAGRLSRGYWLAWSLIVLGVSVEFSLVFWSSTLIERQVDTLADATLVATSFYAGMATSRVALSLHVVSSRDPVWMMRAGLVLALLGRCWPGQGGRAGRAGHLPRRPRHGLPLSARRSRGAGPGTGAGSDRPGWSSPPPWPSSWHRSCSAWRPMRQESRSPGCWCRRSAWLRSA